MKKLYFILALVLLFVSCDKKQMAWDAQENKYKVILIRNNVEKIFYCNDLDTLERKTYNNFYINYVLNDSYHNMIYNFIIEQGDIVKVEKYYEDNSLTK